MTSTNKRALIIGATGGFGSAITKVMAEKGWQVNALTRKPVTNKAANINWVTGDLDNPESLVNAAADVDVIVHSVNVPYPQWDPVMVNYTHTIIQLAQKEDAHLIFIGNVYNCGIPADGVIRHDSPEAPVNEKGEIRSTLEKMIRQASDSGLRATIMRFGDFFGPGISENNWFSQCTNNLHKNKLNAPGPLDLPHSWVYLPDAAKATEKVASARMQKAGLPNLMVLPYRGHVFSFNKLQRELEAIKGQPLKISATPWMIFKALGLVWPLMRDIVSMRYLWQHELQLDESELIKLIGKPEQTSMADALKQIFPRLKNTIR